ncbi:unnamed protein product, partial [Nesidiocoris tenuis]
MKSLVIFSFRRKHLSNNRRTGPPFTEALHRPWIPAFDVCPQKRGELWRIARDTQCSATDNYHHRRYVIYQAVCEIVRLIRRLEN